MQTRGKWLSQAPYNFEMYACQLVTEWTRPRWLHSDQ